MPQKIFNPPTPVLKAGQSVSCSCVYLCVVHCVRLCGLVWWASFPLNSANYCAIYVSCVSVELM